ncbi:MAG TPA: hypothetical protein VL832_13920 [Puia sp.]|jgi:hypothetical protein|nr:hypothetical protein [Puia sp.]
MKHAFIAFLLITFFTVAVVSCSKNNSGSRPKIVLKSINTQIPPGGGLNAVFDFTQGSAELANGTFAAIRIRLNQIPLPPGTTSADTLNNPIPEFPAQNKGQFQFQLDYNFLHQSDVYNDTIIFKFAAIDVAGKSSDTLTSPQIVIEHP